MIYIAAVLLVLLVAHAVWTVATDRRVDWSEEGNARPWW